MCGRYSLEASPQEIVEAFALAEAIALAPRYNVAPTQDVPVVRADRDTGARHLALVRWGLTPHWWTRPRPLINARAETLQRKFQRAFHRRRCLVPATGFFEWQKLDGARQPFHVQRADRQPFAFAGLWERYRADDGSSIDACAIVTTTPNATMIGIHDRMPVILDPQAHAAWLDPDLESTEALEPWLRPAPDDLLSAYPVSTRVNRTANDDPACVKPLARQSEQFDERLF